MKEHFNDEFPVILKTSTGSQTGVGVLIMESMRSLNSTVQMLKLKDDVMPLLVQEYIKTDHDVRVIILDGEVKAVMKREVIQGDDFRSNVSLGAGSDEYELTDIERDGMLKGLNIDFIKENILKTNKNIIVGGGLSNYDDLINLKKISSSNLEGVIAGKSFYSGNDKFHSLIGTFKEFTSPKYNVQFSRSRCVI